MPVNHLVPGDGSGQEEVRKAVGLGCLRPQLPQNPAGGSVPVGRRAAPWAGGGAWPGPAAATAVMALDVGTWHGMCGGPQAPSGATGETLDGITGLTVGQPLWELDS